jgi:hypothetical protein
MKKALLIAVLLISLVPVAAWAIYKPVRVLTPELVPDVLCVDQNICIDNESRLLEALELYENGLQFVADAVGPFKKNPRVVFCTTEACYQSFGFERSSACAVGTYGIVVSPRGWKAHYLRHEMIHHRQAEELGLLSPFFYPEWLIEGMAYSLSEDPRRQLAEPWQKHRHTFDDWFQGTGKNRLWSAASAL